MITRRNFIKRSGSVLTVAGTGISVGFSPFAQAGSGSDNAMVQLFFRGGMDALNFLVPLTGTNRTEYESKRPNIQVPTDMALSLDGDFGLPSTCSALASLYNSGDMAMIHAVGMPDGLGSRSHFDSMAMFEQGIPGQTRIIDGWLSRHMASAPATGGSPIIPAMSPGIPAESLKGNPEVLSVDTADTDSFHPNPGKYEEEHMLALSQMFQTDSKFDQAMQSTLYNIGILINLSLEIPDTYPDTSIAQDLGLIAQIIKADLGMQIATVDFDGWDTHENSGNQGTGYFVDRLGEASEAIGAFFDDLEASGKKNNVVLSTQTDFGRRVRENGNRGTDHGTAQAMMVVGGNVNGGKIYGQFPGISNDDLYLNTDLAMTTDFRRPLGDIVQNHLANPNLDVVFPEYTGHLDMGLIKNSVAVEDGMIFRAGFE